MRGQDIMSFISAVKCYFEELKCLQNRTELWTILTFFYQAEVVVWDFFPLEQLLVVLRSPDLQI